LWFYVWTTGQAYFSSKGGGEAIRIVYVYMVNGVSSRAGERMCSFGWDENARILKTVSIGMLIKINFLGEDQLCLTVVKQEDEKKQVVEDQAYPYLIDSNMIKTKIIGYAKQ
jgi:hypothetical protein